MADYSMQLDTTPQIGEALQGIANELTQVGEALVSAINSRLADTDGATKEQFMLVQQHYNQAHEEMTQKLQRAQHDLMQIHELITHGEKVGTQTWS
ncbi:hypothetical protein [Kutzneria sp. NPDC051319]|jgi:hypothetical protein|uniref:hypothetical protein n=1 Tax=Kutzneria sp. NPDC051319 TaxID=3155047 RepID=UPI00343469C0